MTFFERWCHAMSLSPRTRITLQNVMLDVERKRPDLPTVKGVFNRTEAHWEKKLAEGASETDSETASASLHFTLDALPPKALCLGPPVTATEEVSRIMDRGPFETFYLRPGAFGHLTRPSAPTKLALPTSLKPRQVVGDAMFTKPLRQCYWITKTSVINRILADVAPEKRATRIRDHLGLQHYRNAVELVEIIYPNGMLRSARVATPTFVEGACSYVYRSPDRADPWGRAVDLEFPNKMDPDELAPEAVHEAIPFTNAFTPRPLGTVRGTRRCSPLKLNHPRPWHDDDPNHLSEYTY